jgi:uncharacterized protein (TIGR02466 family)
MNFDLYFPTPVWWEDTGIDTSDMVKLCHSLKEQDPVGRKLSNDGGWQSKDFRPGIFPELKVLEDKIIEQTHNCIRDFGFDEEWCFPVLENLWFNINYKFNSNMVHMHDGSFVSGAFYVKAKPGQGKFTVYKNFMQDFCTVSFAPMKNFKPISASAISYDPVTSRLIMFPGWLPHGVSSNETDEERISISFNMKIIRTDDERYSIQNITRD